jgi:hypothetical protein
MRNDRLMYEEMDATTPNRALSTCKGEGERTEDRGRETAEESLCAGK